MDGRLFATPDRIIEAAALFASEGCERSFEEVLREPVPAFYGAERPMRAVRSACRPAVEAATYMGALGA